MTDTPRSVAICLFLIPCFASDALADDFKTIKGKEYKDATIIRVEGDGIVLRTKTGISKVYFVARAIRCFWPRSRKQGDSRQDR